MGEKPLLSVKNYKVQFENYDKRGIDRFTNVISDINLTVKAGEITAVVGSSGSGKSILAHGILGILPKNAICSGEIIYDGEVLTEALQKRLRGKEISLIPQSIGYLDPVMNVGNQMAQNYKTKDGRERVSLELGKLGLSESIEKMYPFQLSGGMARRVLIGGGTIQKSKLLIADEPTTGLDLPRAISALKILRELAETGVGVMIITHDIDLAVNVADRISVFYAGTTMENAPARFFKEQGKELRHPYSRALFEAMPQNGFKPLVGRQPLLEENPKGCAFYGRCPLGRQECANHQPPLTKHDDGEVRCFYGA